MATLYLVATPIGNLEDMSARAIRTLREARLIAAEDTRQTLKLLHKFDIHTPLLSYHEHSGRSRLSDVLQALDQGDVALVSDAGTPALNDPGYELVVAALQAGHTVSPVPGPSAPVAALVASGLPTDTFLYLGYLPRKSSERLKLFAEINQLPYTLVFLETPHRLLSALEDLQKGLGDRQAALARELTKLHEEIFRGQLSAAQAYFREKEPRGEFTLVVAGYQPQPQERWDETRLESELRRRLAKGAAPAAIAGEVASLSGWPRRQVYNLLSELRQKPADQA